MSELVMSAILMTPPQGQGGEGGGMMPTLIMFGVIFLIMYFLMIRPQQKRQKELQEMVNNLQNGDKVVTSSGIHGRIISKDDATITLEVADNVKIKFEKAAIASKATK